MYPPIRIYHSAIPITSREIAFSAFKQPRADEYIDALLQIDDCTAVSFQKGMEYRSSLLRSDVRHVYLTAVRRNNCHALHVLMNRGQIVFEMMKFHLVYFFSNVSSMVTDENVDAYMMHMKFCNDNNVHTIADCVPLNVNIDNFRAIFSMHLPLNTAQLALAYQTALFNKLPEHAKEIANTALAPLSRNELLHFLSNIMRPAYATSNIYQNIIFEATGFDFSDVNQLVTWINDDKYFHEACFLLFINHVEDKKLLEKPIVEHCERCGHQKNVILAKFMLDNHMQFPHRTACSTIGFSNN